MHIYPNHLRWNAQTVGKIDLHNRRETWAVKVLLKAPQILVEPANAFHVKKPAEMVDLLRPPTDEETATFFSSLNPSVPAKLDVRADAYGGKGVFVKRGCTIAQGDVS